jgi:hypothetical protein
MFDEIAKEIRLHHECAELLIYRGEHYCQNNEAFISNLNTLFMNDCIELI